MRTTAIAYLLVALLVSTARADVFRSEPDLAVPDNTPAGVTTVIQANPACTMNDVEIAIEMDHSFLGDLIFRVTHNNITVAIVDRPGYIDSGFGCGGDVDCAQQVVLDDDSGTPIETFCQSPTIPAGSYGPNEVLSAFDGGDQSGDWTLFISDNAPVDTGSLCAWEVRTACGPNAVEPATWGAIKERYQDSK